MDAAIRAGQPRLARHLLDERLLTKGTLAADPALGRTASAEAGEAPAIAEPGCPDPATAGIRFND